MQRTKKIGEVNWSTEEIKESIPEFLRLYESKPIDNNEGGMKSPHMFATWFILRKINPTTVIESGVWKGQGTWLIEKTLPNCKIYCIDINLSYIEYKLSNALYFDKDFSEIDWSIIRDKQNTLLFFDDHQNAFERVKLGNEIGFKHFIFEDNYPAKQGDCYSLKKVFMDSGFAPVKRKQKGLINKLKYLFNRSSNSKVIPNSKDSQLLQSILDLYYEFPPVLKVAKTRWGDPWSGGDYQVFLKLFLLLCMKMTRAF